MSRVRARLVTCLGAGFAAGCLGGAAPPELLTVDCPNQRRGWTAEELSAIAFEAGGFPARGRRGDDVVIVPDRCTFVVSIDLREAEVSSHDSVVISATDGTVLHVVGGM